MRSFAVVAGFAAAVNAYAYGYEAQNATSVAPPSYPASTPAGYPVSSAPVYAVSSAPSYCMFCSRILIAWGMDLNQALTNLKTPPPP